MTEPIQIILLGFAFVLVFAAALVSVKGFGLIKIGWLNFSRLKDLEKQREDCQDQTRKAALDGVIDHCQALRSRWILREPDLEIAKNTQQLGEKIAGLYHPQSRSPLMEARLGGLLDAFLELKNRIVVFSELKGVRTVTQFRLRHVHTLSKAWEKKEQLRRSTVLSWSLFGLTAKDYIELSYDATTLSSKTDPTLLQLDNQGGASGSLSVSPTVDSTYTLKLFVVDENGNILPNPQTLQCTVGVNVPAPVISVFSANTQYLPGGGNVTLNWTAANTDELTINSWTVDQDGALAVTGEPKTFTGAEACNGSFTFENLDESTTYQATAKARPGYNGNDANSEKVMVLVLPAISALNGSISNNQLTLFWDTKASTNCVLSGDATALAENGSKTFNNYPPAGTNLIQLTANSNSGTATKGLGMPWHVENPLWYPKPLAFQQVTQLVGSDGISYNNVPVLLYNDGGGNPLLKIDCGDNPNTQYYIEQNGNYLQAITDMAITSRSDGKPSTFFFSTYGAMICAYQWTTWPSFALKLVASVNTWGNLYRIALSWDYTFLLTTHQSKNGKQGVMQYYDLDNFQTYHNTGISGLPDSITTEVLIDGEYAYVLLPDVNTAGKIDLNQKSVIEQFSVGPNPVCMAMCRGTLYIGNKDDGSISVIYPSLEPSASAQAFRITNVCDPNTLKGMAADDSRLYVFDSKREVAVVDIETNMVASRTAVPVDVSKIYPDITTPNSAFLLAENSDQLSQFKWGGTYLQSINEAEYSGLLIPDSLGCTIQTVSQAEIVNCWNKHYPPGTNDPLVFQYWSQMAYFWSTQPGNSTDYYAVATGYNRSDPNRNNEPVADLILVPNPAVTSYCIPDGQIQQAWQAKYNTKPSFYNAREWAAAIDLWAQSANNPQKDSYAIPVWYQWGRQVLLIPKAKLVAVSRTELELMPFTFDACLDPFGLGRAFYLWGKTIPGFTAGLPGWGAQQ